MANTAFTPELKLPETEKQLLDQASRHAADVQAAMSSLEVHLRDASKLLGAVERINTVFASVADRLGNATFKASIDTTHGKSGREVAVAFVKELSDLACLSFQGTRDLRRELNNAKTSSTTVLPALRQAATAMQSLSSALKALATRPSPAATNNLAARAPQVTEVRSTANPIIVETRPSRRVGESAQVGGEGVGTGSPMGFFPSSRARRFSN